MTTAAVRRQQRGEVQALPKAVAHWRKVHKGWSQETLARMASKTAAAQSVTPPVKVSPSTIAMIELGKRQPSRLVADAIAEAMGIDVEAFAWICDDTDDEAVS